MLELTSMIYAATRTSTNVVCAHFATATCGFSHKVQTIIGDGVHLYLK